MDLIQLRDILAALYHLPPLAYLAIVAALFLVVAGVYYTLQARKNEARPPARRAHDAALPPPGVLAPTAPLRAPDAAPEPASQAQLDASPSPETPVAPPVEPAPVVSIVPDPQSGGMQIIVGGKRYASLLEVPEAQRPEVVRAIDNLIKFGLDNAAGRSPAAGGPEPALPTTATSPAPRLDAGPRTITPRPAVSTGPDEYEEARKRHERIKRISSLAGSFVPAPQEPATPAFFDAINAIIERRIADSDDLRGRVVRMRTNAQGDLQVTDGTQVFPSVDEVADDAVRALIKASIAEWEGQG